MFDGILSTGKLTWMALNPDEVCGHVARSALLLRTRARGPGMDGRIDLDREHHVSDELYEQTPRQFSEQGLVDLTLAVGIINAWNRIAISFRSEDGSYQPSAHT